VAGDQATYLEDPAVDFLLEGVQIDGAAVKERNCVRVGE
jgi:hypothetical protein